jgi:hypothetical protein
MTSSDADFVWGYIDPIINDHAGNMLDQFPPSEFKGRATYFGFPRFSVTGTEESKWVSYLMTVFLYARIHNVFMETQNIVEPRIFDVYKGLHQNLDLHQWWDEILAKEDESELMRLFVFMGKYDAADPIVALANTPLTDDVVNEESPSAAGSDSNTDTHVVRGADAFA